MAKLRWLAFQVIQIILAFGIVGAYASVSFGVTRSDSLIYLLTNLISSAGLTITAVVAFQLGFVITNALWAAVSTAGLVRLAVRRAT